MLNAPTVPVLVDEKGIDIAFAEIQVSLLSKLSWLDSAYGKAQRLKRIADRRKVIYPAIYTGTTKGTGYEDASPSDHFGNFCFFVTYDPEEIKIQSNLAAELESKFGLIFWADIRKVYPADWKRRSIENVKHEVTEFFRNTSFSKSSVRIGQYYEDAENIYKGFTDKEMDNQFLMRPYLGFRLEGTIQYFEKDIRC